MSILSNLTIKTKIDPSVPRDVLVSYVTFEIATILHTCAKRGFDPYDGKNPRMAGRTLGSTLNTTLITILIMPIYS